MKINKSVQAALAKKAGTGKQVQASKSAKKAQPVKATVKAALKVLKTYTTLLLLSGIRGYAVRKVEVRVIEDQPKQVRALQDGKGNALGNAEYAEIDKTGHLTGKRAALVPLGGYVNGKMRGAKVEELTEAQFHSRSHRAKVKWNADKEAITGRYIGNPTMQGMVAVEAAGHFWQLELDANVNNKHERGDLLPIGSEKLTATK